MSDTEEVPAEEVEEEEVEEEEVEMSVLDALKEVRFRQSYLISTWEFRYQYGVFPHDSRNWHLTLIFLFLALL